MKRVVFTITLIISICHAQTNRSVSFTFTLANAARTSAGVFKPDSTLVRTLWGGVNYPSGIHTAKWDGVDDEGNLAADGVYHIRVLSNNVKYEWEGVIGNTSDSASGPTVHHSMDIIHGMAFTNGTGYYARDYNEKSASQVKFDIINPQIKKKVLPYPDAGQGSKVIATDGVNNFWGGNDPNSNMWFVFATKTADDSETIFSGSTPVRATYGRNYPGAIDVLNNVNGFVSGLAVQRTGNYLFVSHQFLNEVHVINKITGVLAQTLSFPSPKSVATDSNNNLWLTYVNDGVPRVEKFSVGSDGSVSSLQIVLPGLVSPMAVGVSTDNNTVIVADGGTSQQLKAYNNVTGIASWVFGDLGGYFNDATVTNQKFYFSDARQTFTTFIAFQPDGTFWVGDPGNSRSQHYTADRTFINRIMYLPATYRTSVDLNNPTRVFSDYIEFKIDYSKPLNPNNGSWTLSKNWGALVTTAYDDRYIRMKEIATLSNGRTYGLVLNLPTNRLHVVELLPNGPLRITSTSIPRDNSQLYPDGSLRRQTMIELGQPTIWSKQQLIGFNAANDPVWGPSTVVASSPLATRQDPLFWGNGTTLRSGEITSSNIVIAYDGALAPGGSDAWHLGGIKAGTNRWLWRTAMITQKQYTGAFPPDGAYDAGNGVVYPGSMAMALDRSVFWGYHGEFWKNSQTNKWNQVYDDGLFVGQFGTSGIEVAHAEAAASMAGNALSGVVVKDGTGNAYLYHNDESYHSGMHRWKITGLSTIAEVSMPVVLTSVTKGLLGQYYEGKNVNNANIKTVRIDNTVNFNWGNKKPTGTNISSPDNFSVSWSGFVQPTYSQLYTFYTSTDDGARLWVNGKLIIDFWKSTGNQSGQITLEAGKRYAIKMEYNENQKNAIASLSWSSPSQAKVIIPSSALYPLDAPDRVAGLDLLEGLPYNTTIESDMYGWTKFPAGNDSIPYTKWWIARTGHKAYDRFKSPDLYVKYKQASGIYTLSRDFGKVKTGIQSWTLSGNINYDENFENHDLTGGMYFDVLDSSAKILSRIHTRSVYNDIDPIIYIYVNNQLLVQGGRSVIQPLLYKYQPFDITASSAGITVKFGPYPAFTTSVLDVQSNWRAAKLMRLTFFTTTSNYDRVVDFEGLKFSTSTQPLLPAMLFTKQASEPVSSQKIF